jgi:thiosulfate dehydrogenase [quinone] large subunit
MWLSSGYAKLVSSTWMVSGTALKSFWIHSISSSREGQGPQPVYDWYHAFLTFMLDNTWYTWLAKFIACGEMIVGICLLLGAFVGIAALFGAVLNFNYALAGSAGTNTVILLMGGFLVTAWTISGYLGLDRYLLPRLGTPWLHPEHSRHTPLQSPQVR